MKEKKSSSSQKLIRRMTDADILDNSVVFFLAAYETTKTEGELDYYSVNKLQYLHQVFQESLRLYPPAYLFVSRECGEDVDLGEIKLKKGMGIQVPSYHLHRDHELWGPDASEFKPERFSPENKSKSTPWPSRLSDKDPETAWA
ncbi:cytochrome P450 3A28 [Caerostris extrusa]|uniref:Cytochrome P450 3A28 n=1 Tax=Caerostris extrusa TaxID=172846 RepID=A0AAV4Y5B2_CAEEX|nr:cytochrome P450 3A28 [Caerostris extrusa]